MGGADPGPLGPSRVRWWLGWLGVKPGTGGGGGLRRACERSHGVVGFSVDRAAGLGRQAGGRAGTRRVVMMAGRGQGPRRRAEDSGVFGRRADGASRWVGEGV